MKYIYRTIWVLFIPIFLILSGLGLGVWSIIFIIYQAICFIRNGAVNKDINADDIYIDYINKLYEKLLPK